MTDNDNSFNLNDEVTSQIAKLLQLALLTGTDVVDNLRQLELTTDADGRTLVLTDTYKSNFDTNLKSMMSKVEELQANE